MSNLINPQLIDGYIDDQIEQSVQNTYTGTLDAPQEAWLDRKLKEEREARYELAVQKARLLDELNDTMNRLVRIKKLKNTKEETIAKYRNRAVEIRLALERIDKIKI